MSTALFDLSGLRALITGSSRGLGLELARGLGEAGAEVVLNGRDQGRLDQAVADLADVNVKTSKAVFDVTDHESVSSAAEKLERDIGPIDILVNNAGLQRRAPLEEFPIEAWREVLEVNLTGVFLTSRAFCRGMIERKRGKIVNICSLMSEVHRPTVAAYTASKGGVKTLTRAMATEWAKHNIQVNGVGPGYFITEMTESLAADPKFDGWIKGRTPAGRWGDPKELIGPTVFLASSASDFVNGQVLYVDGGILSTL